MSEFEPINLSPLEIILIERIEKHLSYAAGTMSFLETLYDGSTPGRRYLWKCIIENLVDVKRDIEKLKSEHQG